MTLDQGQTLVLVPHQAARRDRGRALAAVLMFAAALALRSAGAAVAPSNDLAKTFERYDRGIILINCKNQKGEEIQLGSGFIIDEKGLAATCFHVLRGASSAEATLADGSKVAVKGVRAWDEMGDIAIIELAATPRKLTALPLRKDPKRQIGESVTAIGHPYGFKFTPSLGIVSGVHTTAELPPPFRDSIGAPETNVWIQTSAAIDSGNSGGPLLNQKGEVLGILTWATGGGQKLGFASDVRQLLALQAKMKAESVTLEWLTGPEEKLMELAREFGGQRSFNPFRKADPKQKEQRSPTVDYLPKVWELAKTNQGKPVESLALRVLWDMAADPQCATNCGPILKEAADRTLAAFADNPLHLYSVYSLQSSRLQETADFLHRLGDTTTNKRMRAAAWLSLALSLAAEGEQLDRVDEAIKWAERLKLELPEVELAGDKVGKTADELAFRWKYQIPGRAPPELAGKDETGKALSLADYRGKVVLVAFWADRIAECRNLYARQQHLLTIYTNRPFALLGVNMDDPDRLRRLQEEKQVTWSSCADGPKGPIASAWRVESLPALFLLDEKGVLRHCDAGRWNLETAVSKMVKALDNGLVQPDKEGNLRLGAALATVHGATKLQVEDGVPRIGPWSKNEDWVTWEVNVLKPGKFKVSATYSCVNPITTALVLTTGTQRAVLKAKSTNDWGKYDTVEAGTVEITAAGVQTFKAQPIKTSSWKGIKLRDFKLEPVKPEDGK